MINSHVPQPNVSALQYPREQVYPYQTPCYEPFISEAQAASLPFGGNIAAFYPQYNESRNYGQSRPSYDRYNPKTRSEADARYPGHPRQAFDRYFPRGRNEPENRTSTEDLFRRLERRIDEKFDRMADTKNDTRKPTEERNSIDDLERRLERKFEQQIDEFMETIKAQTPQPNGYLNNRGNDNRPVCHYCRRRGHLMKECWTRTQDEARRNTPGQDIGPPRVNRITVRRYRNGTSNRTPPTRTVLKDQQTQTDPVSAKDEDPTEGNSVKRSTSDLQDAEDTNESISGLFIKGKFCGKDSDILIDSGAEVSLVSQNFLNDMLQKNTDIEVQYSDIQAIRTLGSEVTVTRRVAASLDLGTARYKWNFYAIDNLDENVVLGKDFLKAYKVIIDLYNDTFKTPSSNPVPLVHKKSCDNRVRVMPLEAVLQAKQPILRLAAKRRRPFKQSINQKNDTMNEKLHLESLFVETEKANILQPTEDCEQEVTDHSKTQVEEEIIKLEEEIQRLQLEIGQFKQTIRREVATQVKNIIRRHEQHQEDIDQDLTEKHDHGQLQQNTETKNIVLSEENPQKSWIPNLWHSIKDYF